MSSWMGSENDSSLFIFLSSPICFEMFQPRNFTKGDDNNPILVGKEKELYESKNWPKSFSKPVNITKVRIDAFKPWITKRVSELMGVEDDIVVDYCIGQLKDLGESDAKRNSQLAGDGGAVFNEKPKLDPKRLQISLTGFMAKKAGVFVRELWDLLLSAQDSEHGIPQLFIDEKKQELKGQRRPQAQSTRPLRRRTEQPLQAGEERAGALQGEAPSPRQG
ncbi:splicing factor [Theileria orientalis strain Shintoku]|uniref:Splicing factor n=1 Tax=Theileria orientalis strain Shintoku TaxID=869250 RepID=J4C3A4_THEOR|nr:splicing factor [Theileria orientalis strain Shintoku]BAM40096.1 splicing factor [Theileria orientalis strain Shintoku]|eukprot:XP_009690397.1 splicing factor [Theileria orientalis strain Shintoku]